MPSTLRKESPEKTAHGAGRQCQARPGRPPSSQRAAGGAVAAHWHVLKLKDEHNDWGATTAAGAFREGAPPGVNRTMELEQSDHLPRVEVPVPSVDMAAWYQRNVIDRALPARGANARDAAIVVKVSRRLGVGALC